MKHLYIVAGLAAGLLTLSACAKNTPPGAAKKAVIAVVNGKPVDADAFDAYAAAVTRQPVDKLTAEQRDQVFDQFVAMQLAADVAVKKGMDRTPEVAAQLDLARTNVLSEAALKQYMEEHPITDTEIKAEYDTQVAAMGRQYHARHILVESKAEADDVIKKLNAGADFAKLAEKESKDGSAKQGGDLGWFSLSTMVPEFAKAVSELDKGKYTQTPVQTQYGWHVIELEDYRTPTPPAFDDVKDRVRAIVQRKKLQAYLDELRDSAKIEKKTPPPPAPADTKAGGDDKAAE